MQVHRLDIRRFRGFELATIEPAGHVLLTGEPRTGRSNVIEGLDRVLSPESTRRTCRPSLISTSGTRVSRAEVEAVLGTLGEEVEQVFFDHLEAWDLEERQLLEQAVPV